ASSEVATATVATNTVTWNGVIPAMDSVTITITATIKSETEGHNIANQGTISFDADNNGTNETSTTTNTASFLVCPSTRVVTTSADSGPGSLRQVILDACPNSTITFDMTPGHVTSPITLTTAVLVIDKDLTIQGTTTASLTLGEHTNSRARN